jgi:glycine cleavage system T protein (aminomethyltransferase)
VSDLSHLKQTPLTGWHADHGGKMVEYAGYSMPVQYEGVLAEHEAVRERVGLFDITHMGEILVTGPGAEAWLDSLVTNRVAGIAIGKVVYNAMCRPDGGVLDDMLVYRLGDQEWLVVCNAANHEKIAAWLIEQRPAAGVDIQDQSDDTALIAIQGPDAGELIRRLTDLADRLDTVAAMDFYTAFTRDGPGGRWLVSRTGYTGEHGYELYLPNADAVAVWEELLEKGQDLGVAPIVLAARDTLRFEVCYCLYGHELGEDITPLEAGIGWAVKLKKDGFVGRDALKEQKTAGVPRKIVCLQMDGRGIARQDTRVLRDGVEIGRVTSGTFSPTLKKALAMALIEKAAPAEGSEGRLAVEIRGKEIDCHQVSFPFLAARTKGDPKAARELS